MRDSGREIHAGRGESSQSDPVDRRIHRIAARQERLITLAQLIALGLTDRQIRVRVERSQLYLRHRGVFIVGPPGISSNGELKAALLALGSNSFLSHRTSLAVQGLRSIDRRKIELTVISGRTPRRPGLVLHRTASEPHRSELRSSSGLRHSSFARALIEVAPRERPEELLRLVTVGVRRNLVDLKSIAAALGRHERQPGIARLRPILDRYLDPTDHKSELERSFVAVIAADRRFPSFEHNVHAGPYELDVVFGPHKLVVELDGRPYHTSLADMERDRGKDIWLQRRGMRIMRITDCTWNLARADALRDVLALLALGGWEPDRIPPGP